MKKIKPKLSFFKNCSNTFLLIYKNGKPKLLKRKYCEKILKKYAKEKKKKTHFKGKEYYFRIRKRFYRIER